MAKQSKLNSMRLLEQHDIPYEAIEFPETMRDAADIADVLGIPPYMVYKTLVVEPADRGKPLLALLAADSTLDLKKLAAAAGHKKVSMAAHKDAERLTGLKVGGISALMLTHKNWPVFLDSPALELEHILVSAGQRGLDLRVPTSALIRIIQAKVADISAS
ncbi:MAG: aminoacyl-tRNA deacylase [Anaerolineaceae bacterium]|nr:aminoacyl-tRNA deacylase [Anaerolineaceae bacterium]